MPQKWGEQAWSWVERCGQWVSWSKLLVILLHVMCACVLSCFSHVRLFMAPWTVARQVPLSMGCSKQEYWSGLSCPTPRDLPDPGVKSVSLMSPAFQADSLPLVPHEKSFIYHTYVYLTKLIKLQVSEWKWSKWRLRSSQYFFYL